MNDSPNSPYGGALVDLQEQGERSSMVRYAAGFPSIRLSPRQLTELAILGSGMLSPLDRYLNRLALLGVVHDMRLSDGTLFAHPLILDIASRDGLKIGDSVTLRSSKNNPVAWMVIDDIFETPSTKSLASRNRYALSGRPRLIELPRYPDFPKLRRTPIEMRQQLGDSSAAAIIGFPFRGPISRTDERQLSEIMKQRNALLIAQPVLDNPKPFDIENFVHARVCAAVSERYLGPRSHVLLRPWLPKIDPSRDLISELIIQRNYGATDLLIDSDEFSVLSPAITGALPELSMNLLALPGEPRKLRTTASKPDFHPETKTILSRAYPDPVDQGLCLWFTGLPSAGKSTIAELVATSLLERGRQVTMLDGDVVRTHLSRGLGFSREDRDANVLRIAFVASEIVRHHGVVICAAVSPYRETRNKARQMVGAARFVEIFVNAPLSVCESRDVKGYYAQARAGELTSFTGVSDPYEAPEGCEVQLDSAEQTPEYCAAEVIRYLEMENLLPAEASKAFAAAGNRSKPAR